LLSWQKSVLKNYYFQTLESNSINNDDFVDISQKNDDSESFGSSRRMHFNAFEILGNADTSTDGDQSNSSIVFEFISKYFEAKCCSF
jgi:hypothetical protein